MEAPAAATADLQSFEPPFEKAPRAALAGSILMLLVVGLAVAVPDEPLRIDRWWAGEMHHSHNAYRADVALLFNWLGHFFAVVVTLGAVGVMLIARRRWSAIATFALAELLSATATSTIKVLVARPRPTNGEVAAAGFAFPSGHAAYCAVTAGALVLLFGRSHRRYGAWAIAAVAIVGMAWSRTYLNVHWLSDVVAGSLLSVGVSLVVFAISQEVTSGGRLGAVRCRARESVSARAFPG